MTTRASILAVSIAAVTFFGSVAAAQPPRLLNGRVTTQTAGSPLAQSFRTLVNAQPDVAWIGYSVPVVDGERVMCCFDSNDGQSFVNGSMISSSRYCCGACRMEPSAGTATSRGGQTAAQSGTPSGTKTGPIKLEGADRMVVLFRIADRKVDRIRVFSEDCELDAGGRPVIWLDGVRAVDSVALLETFAVPEPERRDKGTLDGAVTAIALHGDASADAALDRLVATSQPDAVRRKVTFWLGNARGAHGLATLQRVLRDDPSIEVRKGAVFGVSQSRQPAAFDVLSALARTDQESRIRSEAIFWLSQKGDSRASAVILQALEKDPAPEVRKKAVFALSQLKDEAGVTSLVTVAKTSTDASVRGEAIFWLGQKAGIKAAGAIRDRIDNDPDTEVKKRAVFALSQMPASEGVPLLINVARTNPNREVRKQAMFWLGQSKDPRAVSFFEEILTRN